MKMTRREKIFAAIEEKYDAADLDMHVHELKAGEASRLNNEGMEMQLEYLADQCGLDWLEQVFLGESKEQKKRDSAKTKIGG
jgi:hypothetical protein